MIFRVSEVESFRHWRKDEDATLEDFVARMRGEVPPSDAMLAGTAFHAALEKLHTAELSEVVSGDFRFVIDCDIELALPSIREYRSSKEYGPLTVTGQFDVFDGFMVEDHKTTSRFNPDRFWDGYQWRYYLDIFGAKRFRWNVFEMKEEAPREYRVFGFHRLEQCAYPGMTQDCERLARDLYTFALQHLPERVAPMRAAA